MGAQGTTTIDFGAFPGKSDASVDVTGQGSILSNSLVEAWLFPVGTVDHSADEHLVETLKIVAGNVQAGTGFTIYGINTSQMNEPLGNRDQERRQVASGTVGQNQRTSDGGVNIGGTGTRIYGLWSVAWVWN